MNQLSSSAHFSLAGANDETHVWSYVPRAATPSNRANAIFWMSGIGPNSSNCLLEAGLTTVQIANTSPKEFKRMIFVGEHFPQCVGEDTVAYWQTCLAQISAANYQNTRIDTFYVQESLGEEFWQNLATMNNGLSTTISW